jgi:hypothetical protein
MAMPIIINTKFSCGDTGKFIGKILHKPIIRANFAAPFQRLTAALFSKRY